MEPFYVGKNNTFLNPKPSVLMGSYSVLKKKISEKRVTFYLFMLLRGVKGAKGAAFSLK